MAKKKNWIEQIKERLILHNEYTQLNSIKYKLRNEVIWLNKMYNSSR